LAAETASCEPSHASRINFAVERTPKDGTTKKTTSAPAATPAASSDISTSRGNTTPGKMSRRSRVSRNISYSSGK
jgi:hypothetical protein